MAHDLDRVEAHPILLIDGFDADGAVVGERERCRRHGMRRDLLGGKRELRRYARAEIGIRIRDCELHAERSRVLIGDGRKGPPTQAQVRQLIWLVRNLQAKFDIPADKVIVQSPLQQPGGVSPLFPLAGFRQQLWTVATP